MCGSVDSVGEFSAASVQVDRLSLLLSGYKFDRVVFVSGSVRSLIVSGVSFLSVF